MPRVGSFFYRSTIGLLVLAAAASCSSGPKRKNLTMSELIAARAADDAQRAADSESVIDRLLAHTKAEQDAAGANPTTRPTVDILVISGGGDWGAFGAGVLKGWGRAPGPASRPTFDVV